MSVTDDEGDISRDGSNQIFERPQTKSIHGKIFRSKTYEIIILHFEFRTSTR